MDTQTRDAIVKKTIEAAPRTLIKHPVRQEAEKSEHIVLDSSGGSLNFDEAIKYINGVHLDVYDFFNLDIIGIKPKSLERLQHIMKWAQKNAGNVPDALVKLNSLMIRLGNWPTGETKLDNVYNWIRLHEYTPSNKT